MIKYTKGKLFVLGSGYKYFIVVNGYLPNITAMIYGVLSKCF